MTFVGPALLGATGVREQVVFQAVKPCRRASSSLELSALTEKCGCAPECLREFVDVKNSGSPPLEGLAGSGHQIRPEVGEPGSSCRLANLILSFHIGDRSTRTHLATRAALAFCTLVVAKNQGVLRQNAYPP